MLSDITIVVYKFFITGNFGVVYMAWHTKENTRIKVAIKTLKGMYIAYVLIGFVE